MSKKEKKVNETKNELVNTVSELFKVKIEVYQLDKVGEKSFAANVNLEDTKPIKVSESTNEGAKFLYKIFNSQNRIKDKVGKSRFFGLAAGKPTFLKVSVNGNVFIDTSDLRMYGSYKMKIGLYTESEFKLILNEIISIYSNWA
jgi:hypothetical protein